MRRTILLLAVAGVAATAAPAASAKSTCSAPDVPSWHSCLSARHVALADGNVLLRRATPALTIRLAHGCPSHLAKRTVVLRTNKGKRLARERVTGHCHGNVARFRVNIRANREVARGTVIRSYWSGIDDGDFAPKVKIR